MILFLKFTFWKLNTSHHMKFLLKPTVDTDSGAEKCKTLLKTLLNFTSTLQEKHTMGRN